jgi:DNA-binding NtrC family response regulator
MVASGRVLVVDDEAVVTKGCRRILGDAGYQVDTAATGQEGLNRAMAGNFDLVVTDLRLPDLNGMELVRALRNRRPEIAVLIITGYGSVPNAVEAVKLGVADYIEKPFTPEQITEAVKRAVGVQEEDTPRVEADLVREVLQRVARDPSLGERILRKGSRVLSGLALSDEAKAALVSGDIAWVEKECGQLTGEERTWLQGRLEAEAW